MKNNNSIIKNELEIFYTKFDKSVKVGTLKLNEKDLQSEASCIAAIQKAIKDPLKGSYTIRMNQGLFASFDIEVDKINKLHKRSENTGVVMPCWNYFE